MRRTLPVLAVAAVAAVVANVAITSTPSGAAPVGPGAATVELRIEHSRFVPAELRARPGTELTIVVTNDDPIGHELIIGDAELHRRHEAGTETVHAARPGEVSVPALGRATTTFTVPAAGTVEFACHLPGHYRYGMRGVLKVAPT